MTHVSPRRSLAIPRTRRAFALLLVLWTFMLSVVVVGSIQSTAYAQAVGGREALARTRAYWAARSGVEATLARVENATLDSDQTNAFRVFDDAAQVAEGTIDRAIYTVVHSTPTGEVLGPADAHAKLNINRLTPEQLLNIEPLMSEDIVASIVDWIDGDDESLALGAEFSYYNSQTPPYQPRNAFFRSMQELELVAGVTVDEVRGEDWNLNTLLDPNEDDDDASLPWDNRDGKLDLGWAGVLTAASVESHYTTTGEEYVDLTAAATADVTKLTGVEDDQAKVIIDHASESGATMADYIRTPLAQLQSQSGSGNDTTTFGFNSSPQVASLSDEQLTKLLDTCSIGPIPAGVIPGRLNINTCERETLEMLPDIPPELVDEIIAERDTRPDGFASIIELAEVQGMSRTRLAQIYDLLTVRSNVIEATVRGRDVATGIEVEIVVTIDRSSVPAVIKEFRVQ